MVTLKASRLVALRFVLGTGLSFGFSALAICQQGPAANPDQALDRAIANEAQLIKKLRTMEPVIETYIQEMKRDEDLGAVPKTDNYFLGKLDLSKEIADDSFIPAPGFLKKSLGAFSHFFSPDFLPRGFAQMVVPDDQGFDRSHYTFQYVRREFLGDVRTLVFDVLPQKGAGRGRFIGRIWVEDQGYQMVRFNGTFGPSSLRNHYTHFDSWRINCGPSLWLPSYVYSEEGNMAYNAGIRHVAFKAQTRLWGYQSKRQRRSDEFTNMTVDTPQGINDQSDQAADNSPVQEQRLWERQAEDNILERLQDGGFISPPGDVDKILDTIITNLEVTNNVSVTPEMRARVMLTTPMESVYVGHTILVSRGLLDVLPDEATLAAVIAHEFAHVLLGHQLDTKYAFTDRLFFKDDQTISHMDLARTEREEDAADEKALELLKKSPYAAQLPKAGLFLKMLSVRGDELPHLIRPLIGNRMAASSKDLRMSALMDQAPELEVDRIDQISALPLGSRVKMDPWNNKLTLLKAKSVALLSPREKFPFEITPFIIHLTREADPTGNPAGAPAEGAGTTSSNGANVPSASRTAQNSQATQ